jgi:hypothetical protein
MHAKPDHGSLVFAFPPPDGPLTSGFLAEPQSLIGPVERLVRIEQGFVDCGEEEFWLIGGRIQPLGSRRKLEVAGQVVGHGTFLNLTVVILRDRLDRGHDGMPP